MRAEFVSFDERESAANMPLNSTAKHIAIVAKAPGNSRVNIPNIRLPAGLRDVVIGAGLLLPT
jgi:hypothetical protein